MCHSLPVMKKFTIARHAAYSLNVYETEFLRLSVLKDKMASVVATFTGAKDCAVVLIPRSEAAALLRRKFRA